MSNICILIPCLFVLICVTNAEKEKSPVLIWSPERSMVNFPDVSSVDSFSSSDFYDHYLLPLMQGVKENAVVFLQDKLSVDDFTKFADVYSIESNGGAFKNVKRLMEDHFSLEVPQVDSPHVAVEKLEKSFDGNVHTVDNLSQIKSLPLATGQRFLLMVNLHPVVGAQDEEKTITHNDLLIGEITAHLQDKGIKYSALFTGRSAQSIDQDEAPASMEHKNRHLMATVEQKVNGTFMNVSNGGIYVYLRDVKVCIKDSTVKDPPPCVIDLNVTVTENIAQSSVKSNNTAEVILELKKIKDAKGTEFDVKLIMAVSLRQDRWTMDRNSFYLVQSSGTGNMTDISNVTVINYDLDKVIPRLYSFHCTNLKLYMDTVRGPEDYAKYAGSRISLGGFQFQVFDIKNDRFFFAQDCVGFFTAGIWMGVVSGLLLVAIMVYGTMMILSLSVMDKFDDPKGKTITVSVGDS